MANPLLRLQIHRWGRFTLTGQAYTYAYCCWALTPQLPVAGHWSGGQAPDCYAFPMDDHADDWLRLAAEAWAADHLTPAALQAMTASAGLPAQQAQTAIGPGGLVHSGGTAHPDWPHIKLGGALRWQNGPHPAVQQRLDMLRALDFDGLVAHLCGPDPFRGVLKGGQ